MSHVVCLMSVVADRATFTWSEGPASFEPYTLDGMVYKDFKEIAAEAREKLADLVKDYLFDEQAMPKSAFALAEAGHELYLAMFQPGAEQARQARQVRRWLEQLAQQHEVDTLEIVVESPWSQPWNIIYDQKPDKAAFLSGDDSPDRWRPFWGLRYNLAGGRKVDPLRRMPLLDDPKVLMVVDSEIRDGLPEEQQKRLADFVEAHKFKMVHSKDDLQEAIAAERPDLLYWLSHASADALLLAGEPISPSAMRKLLQQDDDENFGGFAFLNACQTAEGGESGSFFEAFHSVGFAGMIGTEHQTIDQFANPLGLDFLEAFLDRGEPVGAVLRKLRGRVPLGLLYGTYCPPDIRVNRGNIRDNLDIQQIHVQGVALGATVAPNSATRTLPPLPDEPYPSLAYYERKDRALFAGRDDDVERFATMLDDASTRILVLHGESGVGKSSFLHAGVIPYLEEECLGYRFIYNRKDDEVKQSPGSVLFVRATNDLSSQLAQALWAFCARPYQFKTPMGESVSVNLPQLLSELLPPLDVGNIVPVSEDGKNWKYGPANYLQEEPSLLGRILAALSDHLPFSLVLVIDQGEEVFTLAQAAEDQLRGRRALDMLWRTAGASGDFKIILCLRTEYYGRVIDRLRRGLHDTGGIREYLLTDFDEQSLVEAIRRPTSAERIPYAADVPFEKYGFSYSQGLAEEVAKRVVRYTAQRRDSVLPLMQVICSQLYGLARQRADKTITLADLETLGGIEGGMRNHVESLLAELLKTRPADKRPVQSLFTQLYLKQADGTLTTALLAEDEVRKRWTGRMPFDELLESCRKLRLLKINSLRIGMEEERRYVSLGHDALAKIAADWNEQLSRGARMRKMAVAIGTVSAVAVVMAALAFSATMAKRRAEISESKASQQTLIATKAAENETIARQRAQELAESERNLRIKAERQTVEVLFEQSYAKCIQEGPAPGILALAQALSRATEVRHESLEQTIRMQLGAWSRSVHALHSVVQFGAHVRTMAVSPDGSRVAVASEQMVKFWDLKNERVLEEIVMCDAPVTAISFSPGGNILLIGTMAGTITLSEVDTGRTIGSPLKNNSGWIGALAMSSDGRLLIAGNGHSVQLWDVPSGKPLGQPLEHEGFVTAVAISPDGHFFVTGTRLGTAQLWSIETQRQIGQQMGHEAEIWVVAFSSDGKAVLVGSGEGRVTRHHLPGIRTAILEPPSSQASTESGLNAPAWHSGAFMKSTNESHLNSIQRASQSVRLGLSRKGSTTPMAVRFVALFQDEGPALSRHGIMGMAISPDDSSFLIGREDGDVYLRSCLNAAAVGTSMKNFASISCVAFVPDGRACVTGCEDGTMRAWEVIPEHGLGNPFPHGEMIYDIATSPDDMMLATGSSNGTVLIWNLKSGNRIGAPLVHEKPVFAVAFSPNGRQLLTGSDDGIARLWDVETRAVIGPSFRHEDTVNSVAFSPDGTVIATASDDRTARLWDSATGVQKGPSLQHEDEVLAVAFSPNGKTLITGSKDHTAKLWDAQSNQILGSLPHSGWVFAIAFSPDGRQVITGCADKFARLWDIESIKMLGRPLQHADHVRAVAFSPDGRSVATGSIDKTARLWEADSGKALGEPLLHDNGVSSVAFSHDGRFFIAGCADGTARLRNAVTPVVGGIERVKLWTEVITGQRLQNDGSVQLLDEESWQQRKKTLRELGGPPVHY